MDLITKALLIVMIVLVFKTEGVFSDDVIEFKVGVPILGGLGSPYDIERVGPAIEMAFQHVNEELLNSSYKLTKLERIYDTECSAARASGVVADLYYREGIVGLIGPACAYALDSVARIANYWNIPVITGLGDGGIFKNKTEYPTLTRLAYCQCRLRKVFGSVFLHFRWSDISMIYDLNDIHSSVLADTLIVGLQKQEFYPNLFSYYGTTDMKEILQKAAEKSRVILLIVPGDSVRQFLLTAFHLGYTQSGEFVFMDFELFSGSYYGNNYWKRGDAEDQNAKEAYTSLLRVALKQPTSQEWMNFTSDVRRLAKDVYNFTYGSEQVNFFVGSFYDAVLVYGMALNETLTRGGDPHDGHTISRQMWNRSFLGVTGDVFIDDNGDRDTSYSILDMDPHTGQFQVVANFWGDVQKYDPVPGMRVHWAGNILHPPPNEPVCGFLGDKKACHKTDPMPDYVILLLVLLVFMAVLLLVLSFGFRMYQKEKSIQSMLWLVSSKDIKAYSRAPTSLGRSFMSLLGSLKDDDMSSDTDFTSQQIFTKVALYKGMLVVIKKLTIPKLDLNRSLILEFKQVHEIQHNNLVKFVGVCPDPGNVCLLTEYCKKGSLQDVLYNEDIALDWTFKLALLKDISMGLMYLHGSCLQYHGRLTSSNCVIDGRFVVKLTDFGLRSFNYGNTYGKCSVSIAQEKLLWTAPEHLRAVHLGQTGSREGDIYSYGVIIEEVSTRGGPFNMYTDYMEPAEIIVRVQNTESPPFRPQIVKSDCPEGIVGLAEKCWNEEPTLRPNIISVQKRLKALLGDNSTNIVDTMLRRMEQYANNLEHIVQDRTNQLLTEKRRSDELLHQILPKSIATQLTGGKHVMPESYDQVTVYFSNIVGFTTLSADSTPFEIVAMLNDLYTVFDNIIDNYDVYKVETIGDAYMVVSGLPIRNGGRHAPEVCRLALKLSFQISQFKIQHKPTTKLQLRIGIHSGSCVAGVVGLKMPRYCLFGDTINTASRMEATGLADCIHISRDTNTLLDMYPTLCTEYRGLIQVKDTGQLDTYWLLGENISVS